MSLEVFHSNKYKYIVQEYLSSTIGFLLENGVEFAVAAEVRHILFEPELPSYIIDKFGDVALFALGGYSFETAHIEDNHLIFEAGFGEENFGSRVSIPLLAIKQTFVDDYPIAINITEPIRHKATQSDTNRSMQALLNNPKNKKLLKEKQK